MLLGNRVPRDYFVTSGTGQSEITVHAGSYHLALRAAGIENANIMTYSSILPGTAVEVEHPREAQQQVGHPYREIVHGEVMETIMAVQSARYGETATAGIIYGWLHREDGSRYGGLVCEYSGSMPAEPAKDHLREMLNELYVNGYDHLELREDRVIVETITPNQMYGTALVALCFQNYDWPGLSW